ncbi:hypothetical protein XENOCAPTIV_025122 [Xenoophorus captivus]|uniref:Transmembrane 9 superfamily member n=1 Tax=Xenoophorus captivus TaxID=1517983 RepID=A0ABV0Q643_9TELE
MRGSGHHVSNPGSVKGEACLGSPDDVAKACGRCAEFLQPPPEPSLSTLTGGRAPRDSSRPIQGIVGEADENGEEHYLWTYKKLEIGYNGNRIVDVNLTSEGKVKLMPNTRIAMSYSDRDLGDEYGWKQVHGDVFRPSSHPLIFSSLIGSGCQIFSVSFIVIVVAMVEDLYTEHVLSSSVRYFIFTSFWAYKIYYVYGFMMLVLVILCIVTVCVTIVCTYFLLNAEDYRWLALSHV